MRVLLLLTILAFSINSNAQIPIDSYRQEINLLKTQGQIEEYWNKIKRIDQEVLLKTSNQNEFDSISISNMIRTALLFEILGNEVYSPNTTVPLLNLSHNYNVQSNVSFWPIIEKCKNVGGIINNFGGVFPSYPLECISLTLYNFSLFHSKNKLSYLRQQLKKKESSSIIEKLEMSFYEQKRRQKLEIVQKVGKWKIEPLKNLYEDGYFELVRMSDNQLYFLKNERTIKLKKTEKEHFFILEIENDPFNWFYRYFPDGELSLFDQNGDLLIEYSSL